MTDLDQGEATGSPTTEKVTPASEIAAAVNLPGKDNAGKPRQVFANKIAALSDGALVEAAEKKIWLSAYANNNPGSDYHWQADAFYDEAQRREKPELYKQAWEKASRSAR